MRATGNVKELDQQDLALDSTHNKSSVNTNGPSILVLPRDTVLDACCRPPPTACLGDSRECVGTHIWDSSDVGV